MRETLQDIQASISIGGKIINNLRFADDNELLGGSKLRNVGSHQEIDRQSVSIWSRLEVSIGKSNVLVNIITNIMTQIFMNGEQLDEVDAFKYLGDIITKDGCSKTEIKTRLVLGTSLIAKRIMICKNKNQHSNQDEVL